MKISPKFYCRTLPPMVDGEMKSIRLFERPDTARIFFRQENSGKVHPSRVCIEVSRSEVASMIDELSRLHESMEE